MAILLDANDMTQLLEKADVAGALKESHVQQAKGLVDAPPRLTADLQDGKGWIRMGPAILNGSGYMGFKSMNRRPGLGVRYLVVLYDIDSGALLALMDANALTTARTAATNAIGTQVLARGDAVTLGILGSGVQAEAALHALIKLRPLEKIEVYSPRRDSREDFARTMQDRYGIPVRPSLSAEELARTNEILLLAFRAPSEPVLKAAWLRPGLHVTGLSSVRPEAREVEDSVWFRSNVVVIDDLGSVSESGDGRSVTVHGFDLRQLPELWELTSRRHSGRTSDEQITMFKSSGNSVQDVATAAAVYEQATDAGIGRVLGDFPETKVYE